MVGNVGRAHGSRFMRGKVIDCPLLLLLLFSNFVFQFGGLESVITAVCDISPRLAKRRELVVLFVVSVCFLGGLPTTTYVSDLSAL